MSGAAGFTLFELLVVLAVAGLILSLTIPRLVLPDAVSEAADAARHIAAGLRETRAAAIRDNRPAELVLDIAERSFQPAGGPWRRLPPGLLLSLYTAEAQIVDDARGAIRFFPDGSSTGGAIALGRDDDDTRREVRIDWLTGRVDVAP